ncbi:hypothetical protein GCM10027344_24810 [Spelaeicoccus albus]
MISGLPGVGKSSVAESVATRIGSVHLSIDALEEAILGCGLSPGQDVGIAAYEAARAAAELSLRLGPPSGRLCNGWRTHVLQTRAQCFEVINICVSRQIQPDASNARR